MVSSWYPALPSARSTRSAGSGWFILNRATGVLNFAYGAIGALGAMCAWQVLQWGYPEPMAWLACLAIGVLLSTGYGMLIAPGLSASRAGGEGCGDTRLRHRHSRRHESALGRQPSAS
jgi:hypothetical protein